MKVRVVSTKLWNSMLNHKVNEMQWRPWSVIRASYAQHMWRLPAYLEAPQCHTRWLSQSLKSNSSKKAAWGRFCVASGFLQCCCPLQCLRVCSSRSSGQACSRNVSAHWHGKCLHGLTLCLQQRLQSDRLRCSFQDNLVVMIPTMMSEQYHGAALSHGYPTPPHSATAPRHF